MTSEWGAELSSLGARAAELVKMSLLDCICCPKHNYRTAVISDDRKIISADTYGNLLERARRLARFMRQKLQDYSGLSQVCSSQQDTVVALWTESCPEAVSGIISILSVPAVYMPMNVGPTPSIPGEISADISHYSGGFFICCFRTQ